MQSGTKVLSKTYYKLRQLSRRLWIRAALIAALGIVAALASRYLDFLVPDVIANNLKAGAVTQILNVMASSMLAVTVFSLSVMVSARQWASAQVTPRSHKLLLEDTTTQTVLATFLGAFVFSLVGLILLGTGYYDQRTSAVILAFTLLVIALVVAAILRWIDHLTELGSLVEMARRVEEVARDALEKRRDWPCLGARALTEGQIEIPARAVEMMSREAGYVQHIDLGALSKAAEKGQFGIFLVTAPGKLVAPGDTILWHTGGLDDETVSKAFTISDTRAFEQDPRFGIIVLAEIAQKALSPGINDPGTAIDVISRLQRLLKYYADERNSTHTPHFPRLWMIPITAEALLRDGFDPIARDGKGVFEIQVRLQKALAELAEGADTALATAARAASRRALKMALPAQLLDEHRERLKALAAVDHPADYSAASA